MSNINCWVIETGKAVVGPFDTAALAAEHLETHIFHYSGPCKIVPVERKLPPLPPVVGQ